MSLASKKTFIGFPTGLLSDRPLRIPIIAETEKWIAFNKPSRIALRQHPWSFDTPNMDAALNKQLQDRKPELLESGASLFGSVYNIEPEISGVALFAKHRKDLDELRNLTGSEKLQFRFLLVARLDTSEANIDELIADAPLLVHNTKPKMIPSTAKGKKAQTNFRRIHKSSGWSLWEANTLFPRLHQIRAHAAVEGIKIMGDSLYSGSVAPSLREMVSRKSTTAICNSIFDGIALHLSEVILSASKRQAEAIILRAPLPKPFGLLLDRLQLSDKK